MRDEDIHIGDTLYVREWDEMLQEGYLTDGGDICLSYGLYFPEVMRRICGMSFTIKKKIKFADIILYESYEQCVYSVTAQMLKPGPFDEIQFEVATDGEIKCLLNIST